MRYVDRGWTDALFELSGLEEWLARAKAHRRYGSAVTDAVFMTSRDGEIFKRWADAFIRPGPAKKGSWVYGDNMVLWGLVQTKSPLKEAPDEISLYATEDYWEGTYTSIRRYILRMDGFVSLRASFKGGEVVTRPLMFTAGNLAMNAETLAVCMIRVEIQDAGGRAIEGYSLGVS